MSVRIPRCTQNNCSICTVAIAMGHPCTDERFLAAYARYPKAAADGRFFVLLESGLRDEGFIGMYCRSDPIFTLRDADGLRGQYNGQS